MNILWLNHRDPLSPQAGGAERTILEIGKRFVSRGHNVTIYSTMWKGAKKEDIIDGIKIVRLGGYIEIHLKLPIFLFKNRYDIIINDLAHAIPWPLASIIGKRNLVFFRHLHARSLPGQVNPFLSKIIAAIEKLYPLIYRNNKFITESSTSEEDLIKLGIKKENIIRIPPGVDLEVFHTGKKTSNVQLIYFGGFRNYKRPDLLLKVYEQVSNKIKDLKIVVAGEGKLAERLKEVSYSNNYNIIFLGRVDQERLSELIRESWVNLHFSVTEGWGYSILESSASGTPTISFKVPGVVETIKNGYNGFLVENIDEFGKCIDKIIKDIETYSENSRKFAEAFNWDKTFEMWMEAIGKIY